MNTESDPNLSVQVSEINPMEVHHHSHSSHGKKRWSGYFWEFLMLFLAVFCGFLAEYRLEHVIEHRRENTFMHNLTNDLLADEQILMTYSKWRTAVNSDFDSLLFLLSGPDPNLRAHQIYKSANQSM